MRKKCKRTKARTYVGLTWPLFHSCFEKLNHAYESLMIPRPFGPPTYEMAIYHLQSVGNHLTRWPPSEPCAHGLHTFVNEMC